MPFVATGRLGPRQIAAAESLLRTLATDPSRPARVVMIHHPPHPGGASPGRDLRDAAAFSAMLGRVGADLVLHGHNHVASVAHVAGPGGRAIPVVGGASASARPGAQAGGHGSEAARRAAYILYAFSESGGRHVVSAVQRGIGAGGTVMDLGPLALG